MARCSRFFQGRSGGLITGATEVSRDCKFEDFLRVLGVQSRRQKFQYPRMSADGIVCADHFIGDSARSDSLSERYPSRSQRPRTVRRPITVLSRVPKISNGVHPLNAKTISLVTAVASALVIAGCAVDNQKTSVSGMGLQYESAVKTLPDGTYYVEVEAAPLAGRVSGARETASHTAREYCASRSNKKMTVIEMKEDSHLLVNGVARLKFKCT